MIIICILIILLLLPMVGLIIIYEQFFGRRYETHAPLAFHMDDFPDLRRAFHPFPSNKDQTLAGYLYYTENTQPKGIIVISHGLGGGGHNSYMDCADFFAHNGYYVFAYDATGNDESEGKNAVGLSQGLIDLDHALSYIQSQDSFRDLPILLFGHSWGGYSVGNVLNYHPEIKAVVSICGFNQASDLIKAQGCSMLGPVRGLMTPYIKIYEYLKFGKYSTSSAMKGFANSDAPVFVIHSQDDTTVPQRYGYDIYYEAYKDSERFTFVHYTDKGHNWIYYSREFLDHVDSLNKAYAQWVKTWPKGLSKAEKLQYSTTYLEENLDRNILCNGLDEDLFAQIAAFYDSSI